MQTFNFRYYPPRLLLFIVVIFLIVYFTVKAYFSEILFTQILQVDGFLFASSSLLALAFGFIATKLKHKWLYKLLDLPLVDGNYKGKLISSYHINDDPTMPHETREYVCAIVQTLNGFIIKGQISNNGVVSSTFKSTWTDIVRNEDGSYQLLFLYQNDPEQVNNPDKNAFQLEIHRGMCQFDVGLNQKELTGHYFNYERDSKGKIEIKRK
jgi:SMODS-associating 2TM, beta-strand rich effector domain